MGTLYCLEGFAIEIVFMDGVQLKLGLIGRRRCSIRKRAPGHNRIMNKILKKQMMENSVIID